MSDPFTVLVQARRLATGASYDYTAPNLEPQCATEPELDALVRDYYTLFNESLSRDASFLQRVQSNAHAERLRRLLYTLRTAANHADNSMAEQEAARWRAQHPSPQAAADALAESMFLALDGLSKIAVVVARSAVEAKRWRELTSVEVSTVFAAVCADLRLNFTDANRKRMVRLIEKRLEVQPGRGDRRTLVAEYCAQQILSDRRPLPVPYSAVLDSLGLLGNANASAAVLVAYAVAAVAPQLRGQDFLVRVREIWEAAGAR